MPTDTILSVKGLSWNIEWNIQLKRKQSIRCIYFEGGKTIKRKAVN